jgi:hypothetical protein
MPTRPITELDFFGAKEQLKTFLKEQDKFKDYDFEGSNMSVLLDVLAYNTYQNNFYANMAISEMFLDSAIRENSVISHAKELNYLPRSDRSAKAIVAVSIQNSNTQKPSIFIPKNTRFTTIANGNNFNFYTKENYIATKSETNNIFTADCVEILEGELVEESFFVSDEQRIITLNNVGVDTTSIKVFVDFTSAEDTGTEYLYAKDIFGIEQNSNAFYLQRGSDSRYEIYFGENKFGTQPTRNQEIRVFYRITNGTAANGASVFRSSLLGSSVTTRAKAIGGADRETVEDIKFFAPKSIQIQERAVTNRDYEILLKQRFNEIKDVSVFGGEELSPPQFGKVAIAINSDGGLSENSKIIFESYLKDKTPIGIQPIFVSPKFLYVDLNINVFYSSNRTTKSVVELKEEIRNILRDYSNISLNKFGSIFELSRVSTLIDNSDVSIRSNTMKSTPYILYSPELNVKTTPTFNFGSSLISPCRFATANNSEVYDRLVNSSNFVYEGTTAIFEDNGLGIINILNARDRSSGTIEVIRRNAGTVNYETGEVKLVDFVVESFNGNGIRVFGNTLEKNVTAPKDQVLLILEEDITIDIQDII